MSITLFGYLTFAFSLCFSVYVSNSFFLSFSLSFSVSISNYFLLSFFSLFLLFYLKLFPLIFFSLFLPLFHSFHFYLSRCLFPHLSRLSLSFSFYVPLFSNFTNISQSFPTFSSPSTYFNRSKPL